MKSKSIKAKRGLEIILSALAGLITVLILYWLADVIWNGAVADWFASQFISYEDIAGAGTIQIFDWQNFRQSAFWILCISGAALALACLAFFFLGARWKKKDDLAQIAALLSAKEPESSDPDFQAVISQIRLLKNELDYKAEKLELESRRKEDLITYLAHDLKTPLASIIGYLHLLQEKEGLSEKLKEKYTGICLDKAYRTEELLNEFFDITRFNLQKMSLEKENVDLGYLLIQMKEEFYPLLKAHGNTIKLDFTEPLCLQGDASLLARVFHNILKNAIAYSYENSPILIHARQKENSLTIVFENKGKTIPSQKLDALFDKFFRLDEARSSQSGGAGLGLAIAKEIILLHQGSIQAESEKETTRFILTLPNPST